MFKVFTYHLRVMPTYQGQKVSYRKMVSDSKLYEIRQKEKAQAYQTVNEYKSGKRECCMIM